MFDMFWHKTLGRPYALAAPVVIGSGPNTVVLLHGLGSSTAVWKHVVERLKKEPYRTVSFDLLGFGVSPKPDWLDYTVDDHARSVITSIERRSFKKPVTMVGHSMGCLVAVRVARLRPDLVKHMVLYEMPLYSGLPEKRRYRLRLEFYFSLYEKVIAYKPTFDAASAKLIERIGHRLAGFELNDTTWLPFTRSLKNTVMSQTASEDIKYIKVPMDVIYGSYDMLVIRGKPRQTFGSDSTHISAHKVRAGHYISDKASKFIVERITAGGKPSVKRSLRTKVAARAKRVR